MKDLRKFALQTPALLSLIAGAAIALGAASSWTPADAQTPSPAQVQIEGVQSVAASRAVTNFSELAAIRSEAAQYRAPIAIHRPLKGHPGELWEDSESEIFVADAGGDTSEHAENRFARRHRVRAANFAAPGDTGNVTPPDTQGTVGPNHLMVTLNNNVTIESRTGTILKTVSIGGFWSSLGNINEAFDPRVLYDPYASRWIISSGANAASPSSYILIGVSRAAIRSADGSSTKSKSARAARVGPTIRPLASTATGLLCRQMSSRSARAHLLPRTYTHSTRRTCMRAARANTPRSGIRADTRTIRR